MSKLPADFVCQPTDVLSLAFLPRDVALEVAAASARQFVADQQRKRGFSLTLTSLIKDTKCYPAGVTIAPARTLIPGITVVRATRADGEEVDAIYMAEAPEGFPLAMVLPIDDDGRAI